MKFKLQPYSIHELGQRENQEDSMFPDYGLSKPEDRLFILCDGMGGHEKGEVASATVCEAMSKTILSRWNPNEPLSDDLLLQAIEDAFDALDAKDNGEAKKMGTTMTFVCFHTDGVTVAHIGDSRVYQLRPANKKEPARIVFETRDHSLVNNLVDVGEITEEEAKTHPQKNVITRAMQPCQERRVKADIKHLYDIKDGDYFYMCSDGMLEQTSDENLLYIITKQETDDTEKMEMLRDVTSENKDNHTAHLIYVKKVEGKPITVPIQESLKIQESAQTPQQTATLHGTWIIPDNAQANKKKSILPMIIVTLLVAIVAAGAYYIYGDKIANNAEGKDVDSMKVIHKPHQGITTVNKVQEAKVNVNSTDSNKNKVQTEQATTATPTKETTPSKPNKPSTIEGGQQKSPSTTVQKFLHTKKSSPNPADKTTEKLK